MAEGSMLTSAQVAERLAVSPDKVRELISDGRLSAIDISANKRRATWRIRVADLEAFISGATVRAPEPKVRRNRSVEGRPTFFPQYQRGVV